MGGRWKDGEGVPSQSVKATADISRRSTGTWSNIQSGVCVCVCNIAAAAKVYQTHGLVPFSEESTLPLIEQFYISTHLSPPFANML